MGLNEKAPATDCNPGEGNENQFTRSNMKGISMSKNTNVSPAPATHLLEGLAAQLTHVTANDTHGSQLTVDVYEDPRTGFKSVFVEQASNLFASEAGGTGEMSMSDAAALRDLLAVVVASHEAVAA